MKLFFKQIIKSKIVDLLISPAVYVSGLVLLFVRKIGFSSYRISHSILMKIGLIPVRRHYYEPFFDERDLRKPLSEDRNLPGIDMNEKEQLELLGSFDYSKELRTLPRSFVNNETFHLDNDAYPPGDAEFWYSIIRLKKPAKIIEIGSGHSTKLARLAITKTKDEIPDYNCRHICIEPYEMLWLEQLGVEVIRNKVELLETNIFKELVANDILFIDSSHIIKPQGDVLFEYLEILPELNPGVIVHIHDIFTPKDYLSSWVLEEKRLWNEQYLLEAFLTFNNKFKVIAALNYLKHNHFDLLKSRCPHLTGLHEPGSFYIEKLI